MFLVAGGAILVFLAAIVPLLVSQTAALVQAAPGYLDRIERFLGTSLDLNLSVERLQAALSAAGQQVLSFSADIAGRVVGIGTAVLGFAFRLLTIAMFAFYFVADGPRFRRSLLSMLRPERQREVLRIWEIAVEKTGGYVYSRVLLAAASSVFTWVALRLIGVPYALALSLWVGVMSQFVPVVGTYIAAVLPTLVALFVSPVKALWVVALLVGYQQVENYLIAPRVTARTMAIHPAIAFGSVIAGVALVGGIGAVLALPTAATIQAVVSTAIERHQVVESRHTTVPAARPGSRVRRDRSTRAQPEDPAPTGSSG